MSSSIGKTQETWITAKIKALDLEDLDPALADLLRALGTRATKMAYEADTYHPSMYAQFAANARADESLHAFTLALRAVRNADQKEDR